MRILGVAVIVSSCLTTGCGMTEPAIPSTMSDGNIISLFNTIDANEIEAAQVARRQASSQVVRDYADRLASEHTALLTQKHALVNRTHLQPEKSSLTSSIEAASHDLLEALTKTSGLEFDRAYIDYQIAMP